MAPPDRLLNSLASEATSMAQEIADLERQEEEIRLKLANARAAQFELLSAADALKFVQKKKYAPPAPVQVPISVSMSRYCWWSRSVFRDMLVRLS